MIKIEMNYGEEEYSVLADLAVDSPREKKGRKIWKVLLILFGVFELGYGVYTFAAASGGLGGICMVAAAAAFFLAFGGERFLVHSAARRRTRKLSQKAGGRSRKITFDNKECTITSDAGTGKFGWDAFTAYGEHSHYLWMRRNDNRYVLIDMNKLSGKNADQLRKYCSEKIKA